MRGFMGRPMFATGESNPLRGYVENDEWKESRIAFELLSYAQRLMSNDPSFRVLRITVLSGELKYSMKLIGGALMNNTTLKILNLRENNFRESNADLPPFDIQSTSFYPVAVALKENTTLTHLNLSYSYFDDFTSALLNEVLKYNTALKSLDLKAVDNFNISVGLSNLGINRGLTVLKLDDANVSDADATVLARGLSANTTLETLFLNDNDISNKGAIRLAMTGLLQNKTLTWLNLSRNKIGNEGAQAFCIALESNTSITTLLLPNMDISRSILKKIKAQTRRNLEEKRQRNA